MPSGAIPEGVNPGDPHAAPSPPYRPPRRHRFANLNLRIAAILVVLIVVGGFIIIELDLTHKPDKPGPPAPIQPDFPTPIQHLIVLFMEDQNIADVLAQGPFERYLATNFAFAQDYDSITSDSLNNYEYATSGAEADSSASNVANLVNASGETWMDYGESMPSPCDTTDSLNINTTLPPSIIGSDPDYIVYDTNHTPFVHYLSAYSQFIGGNATAYCQAHVVNLDEWDQALASGTIPNYVWITPNDTDDDHDCPPTPTNCSGAIAHGDAWLRAFLNPFLNSSLFASSAILLTYDYNDTEGYVVGPANVYFAAISPFAHRYFTSSVPYNPYNILTTTEYLLGLGHTGHNDGWTQIPPMTDLFNFNPTFVLTGTVMNSTGPVAGAPVEGDGFSITTGANGNFQMPLSNGTYGFFASSPDGTCSSSVQDFTISGATMNVDFRLSC
ncbi:MAG: alkaline phosphatase family protein [Thermoplasmata archaeon]